MSDGKRIEITDKPAREDELFHEDAINAAYAESFADANPGDKEIKLFFFLRGDDDRILASAQCTVSNDFLFVATFHVDKSARNRGLAIRLLSEIEDEARRRSKIRILLYTYGFQGVLPFWKRFGFQVMNHIEFVKPSPESPDGFSSYYLEKSLSPTS